MYIFFLVLCTIHSKYNFILFLAKAKLTINPILISNTILRIK